VPTNLLQILLGLLSIERRLDRLNDALAVDAKGPLVFLLPRWQGLKQLRLDLGRIREEQKVLSQH
jgi:hypothetical protein